MEPEKKISRLPLTIRDLPSYRTPSSAVPLLFDDTGMVIIAKIATTEATIHISRVAWLFPGSMLIDLGRSLLFLFYFRLSFNLPQLSDHPTG